MRILVASELETCSARQAAEIMIKTFNMRRRWIVGENKPNLHSIFEKYPAFYRYPDQVKTQNQLMIISVCHHDSFILHSL